MQEKGQIIPDVVRLYRKDDLYSDEANEFASRADKILRELFDDAKRGNFSYRDLAHILIGEVQQLQSEYQIKRGMEASDKRNPRMKFNEGGRDAEEGKA